MEQPVTTLQAVCTQPVALSSAGCRARRRSRHGPRSAAGRTPKPRRTGVPELPFALFRLCKTGGCDRCTALRKQLFLILEQWTVIKDSSRRRRRPFKQLLRPIQPDRPILSRLRRKNHGGLAQLSNDQRRLRRRLTLYFY